MDKGFNFKLISNEEFNVLVNKRYQEILLEGWKTEKKGKASWKKNPELEDAVLKLMDRLFMIALKEFKEYVALRKKMLDETKEGEK